MHLRFVHRTLFSALTILTLNAIALAGTTTVSVHNPANGSTDISPVNYQASATTDCAQGIAAFRVYSAPGVVAYTVLGNQLNTFVKLPLGTSATTVVAYDNCGGAGKADVTVTATGQAPPGGFVYTANSDYFSGNSANFVQGFSIVAGNGALVPTGQGSVKANVDPSSVASDKGGFRLYVGDRVSGDVFPYFINRSNGYLTPVPGAPFPVNHTVTAVAVHPSGKLIFATRNQQAAGDGVAVFELQSDGSLRPAPGSPYLTQTGPQSLVVDPSGKYLYVADQNDFIDAFAINTTSGMLTRIAGSPFKLRVPSSCASGSIADSYDLIDVGGKRLYTADISIDSISAFNIGTSGGLKELTNSPWADEGGCNVPPLCSSCGYNPMSLAVDGTGKFLYGLNGEIPDIAIYSIGTAGGLTYVKDTAYNMVSNGPLRADATGSYLYAASSVGVPNGYTGLVGFSINHQTGDLTELPTSPYEYPTQSTTAPVLQGLTVTP